MSSVQINQSAIHAMAIDPAGPIGKLMEKYAIKTETLAKVLVKLPGTGKMYLPGDYFFRRGAKVYHFSRVSPHQASAPGEPPSGDTGYLGASINHTIEVRETVVAVVKANANYGIYLELGTRFMAPRPFLRPALMAAMKS